jgi:hypothetical protein
MSIDFHNFCIPANEAPDPSLEQAGILCLQAQELTVEHFVSVNPLIISL